jgi:HK97 family phage major capsid protein
MVIELEQRRQMTLEYAQVSSDVPNVIELSFSSEYPVERSFGLEILEHSSSSCDLSRVSDGACPLLWNHDPNSVIGTVQRAWIDASTRKGRAVVEFDIKCELGAKIFGQVSRGVTKNVSCFYKIIGHKEGKKVDGKRSFLITRWHLVEISIVSCPEDPTVGVGRSVSGVYQVNINTSEQGRNKPMDTNEQTIDRESVIAEARKEEQDRQRAIAAMPAHWGPRIPGGIAKAQEVADQAISNGMSAQDARNMITDLIMAQESQSISRPAAALDLSNQEQKQYSLLRAIHAHVEKDWSNAGFELECSRAIAKQTGGSPQGFYVPITDLKINQMSASRAAELLDGYRATYSTATPSAAGNLVATILDAGNFIDVLRNQPRVMQAGAKLLTGLVGNLDIPRQSAAGQTYWVSEGAGPADSNASFDKVTFTPKTLGALSSVTRLMMLQSTPDIEMLARQDIANIIALEIDRVGIDGSGAANQPRGLLNSSGMAVVALGPNGAPITYDSIIDLETAVAVANADDANLAYMTNAKVVGNLKKLKATTNEYLWIGTATGLSAGTPGSINGYPVFRTNQIPSNKTKGTGTALSSVVFGDWSQLMYANWGVLDILPNPFGTGYQAGNIEIRALQSMDVQIRHKESFSLILDAVTS